MKIYYVMDPMCSWCWGFRQVFRQFLATLPPEVEVQYVMGGLATDTDAPMPDKTRDYVQSQWQAVAAKTGARFNWDFWTLCQPRRATYPACRAVVAAGLQNSAAIPTMIDAIQKAYYQQARNPSDDQTLVELAREMGLNAERFTDDLNSEYAHKALQADFKLGRELGITSFPSVLLENQHRFHRLATGSSDIHTLLDSGQKAGLLTISRGM